MDELHQSQTNASGVRTTTNDSLGRYKTPKDLPDDRSTRILRVDEMNVIPRLVSHTFPPRLARRRPILGDDPQPGKLVRFVIVLAAIGCRSGQSRSGGDERVGGSRGEGERGHGVGIGDVGALVSGRQGVV